jgi:hypothetical protein
VPAPADYYTRNLAHMFAWVRRHHARLLDARLARWMERFEGLPEPARHLFVRLLLRRGPDFRIDRIAYPGVDDARSAALALALGGFGALVTDPGRRLESLRVPELKARLRVAGVPAPPRARRTDLLEALASAVAGHGALPLLLRLTPGEEIDCLRMLYFGSLRQDLVEFIVADVGALRWPQVTLDPSLPFETPAQVRSALRLHRLADLVSELHHVPREHASAVDPRLLDGLTDALSASSPCSHTEGRRARALLRIAALQGRQGRRCAQLRALRRAGTPAARERACRLLAGNGRRRAAERLRSAMLRAPADAREARFAERFDVHAGRCRPRRRGCGVPVRRLRLAGRSADMRVEARVAALFAAAGNRVLHMENRLPGMLFALGFWDVVFSPLPGAFVQPFQAGPTDLHGPSFRARRREAIATRLADIAADRFGVDAFLEVLDREQGRVNAFWGWQDTAHAEALLRSVPASLRAGICDVVAAEPGRARAGFPDLVVGNGEPGCCAFIEVKGPGDQLREDQRRWIEDLRRLGARAEVLEVRW